MLAWIQESTLWAEVDASGFINYNGGIFDSPTCSQTEIDHVVNIRTKLVLYTAMHFFFFFRYKLLVMVAKMIYRFGSVKIVGVNNRMGRILIIEESWFI